MLRNREIYALVFLYFVIMFLKPSHTKLQNFPTNINFIAVSMAQINQKSLLILLAKEIVTEICFFFKCVIYPDRLIYTSHYVTARMASVIVKPKFHKRGNSPV